MPYPMKPKPMHRLSKFYTNNLPLANPVKDLLKEVAKLYPTFEWAIENCNHRDCTFTVAARHKSGWYMANGCIIDPGSPERCFEESVLQCAKKLAEDLTERMGKQCLNQDQ